MKNLLKVAFAITLSTTLLLSGCSSNKGSGTASGGYKYGTGPNKTRPMPQTSPVNLQGVGGSKPIYESQRSGGCNKDYRVLGKNYMIWNGADSYIEEGTASWYGPGFHGKKTSNGEVYNQKGYTAAHKNLPLPAYLKVTNLRNGKKVIVRVNDRGPFVGDRIIDLSEGSARAIDMVGTGTAKVRIELIKVKTNGSYANATGTPSGLPTSAYSSATLLATNSASKILNKNTASYTHIGATTSRSLGKGIVSEVTKRVNESQLSTTSFVSGNYIQLVACNSDLMASEIKQNVSAKISYPVVIHTQGNINRVLVGPLSETQARQAVNTLKAKGYTDCFVKRF